MQQHDRQRLIGVGVILLISIIFLLLLLYHPLPGVRNNSLPLQTAETHAVTTTVYELPLAPIEALANKPATATATLAPALSAKATAVQPSIVAAEQSVKTRASLGQDRGHSLPLPNKKAANLNWQPALNNVLPDAWVVQVASFSSWQNATTLVGILRKKGLLVYTKQQQRPTGTITQVLIGPYIDQKKAKLLQQKLRKNMQLHGVIVKYVS